ncbi:hypothetical protein AX17_001325 [Amanita inopinata Kibby_2008]|nr:hypothetical protein AX17_001325 [Amanita inopinata Kibby_2008]
MAPQKRKRDDLAGDDDDERTYGRQILPVADLPADFDRPPADGMEYLFTVRRDARSLPDVTRVENPFEVTPYSLPPTISDFTPSHPALPCAEWRTIYQMRFRNFRKNFNQPTIHVQYVPKRSGHGRMPEKKERDLWWAFLSGEPESTWNPPKTTKVQKPKKRKFQHAFADDEETVLLYELPQTDVDIQEACSPELTTSEEPLSSPVLEQSRAREPVPSLLKRIDEACLFFLNLSVLSQLYGASEWLCIS